MNPSNSPKGREPKAGFDKLIEVINKEELFVQIVSKIKKSLASLSHRRGTEGEINYE